MTHALDLEVKMPNLVPLDDSARARLREAQKTEAAALAAVQAAERRRARTADALQRAEDAVAAARIGLVRTSGIERTALLLALSPKDLRREVRGASRDDR